MKVEDASPRDESQPIIKQEMVSHDSREPMEGEETGVAGPESSPAGPGQGAPELVKGIEASQNIAFHRLSDLLSFVWGIQIYASRIKSDCRYKLISFRNSFRIE